MDPWKLQRMAGHASIRTSQRYVHQLADDEPSSEAREQLDQMLEQASDEQLGEILRVAVGVLARAPECTP